MSVNHSVWSGGIIGISSDFLYHKGMFACTHENRLIIYHYQYKNTMTQNYPKYNNVRSYGIIFGRDSSTISNRAISVQAAEVLSYF